MTGTGEVPSGLEASGVNVEDQSTITIPMGTIAALFTRINELEQKLKGFEAKLSRDETPTSSKEKVSNSDPPPEQDTDAEDPYTRMIDYFREQITVDGLRDWVPMTMKDRAMKDPTTQEKIKDKDGHLPAAKPFALHYFMGGQPPLVVISKSAAIYDDMLRLLPPDSNEHVFHDPDDGVFEIQSHFLLLHIKSDIEDMLNKTPASLDPRRHHELEVFANMYTKESALADAWKKYSDLTRRKMIDWKNLKGLFRKGQLVVHRVLPNDWAVSKVTSVGSSTRSSDSELVVRLESIDNDGKGFRYVWSDRTFKPFPNERRISELNVFPLDYHDDRESLEKMAIASGKRWKRLYEDMFNKASRTIQIQVMEYDGYATRKEDKGPMTHVSSRVVVDPRIQAKRTDLSFIQDSRIPFVTENKDTEEPTNEQYLLCPATVLVHALSDNELYHVPTKRLREANWCRDGWSRLVIDEDIKHQANHLLQLSRAREIQHAKGEDNGSYISGGQGHDEDQSIDNFRGKGRGLIFLLHGPPGVGKTLLAECLSEEQRRPLYRVSLSNLTNYDERRIDKLFREAHMWNAILLIDEAEVILAERTMENMKQSAWVAVFLRKIEYFEGILFLTTNQIHFIDQAFESRVTVGIRFPKMDRDQRVKVWQKLLEPPAKKLWGSDALITTKERLGRWADRELNGRHIHNVINSAQILTRGGDPRKPSELIENCLDAVTGFMNMIKQEKEDERKSYLSNWY